MTQRRSSVLFVSLREREAGKEVGPLGREVCGEGRLGRGLGPMKAPTLHIIHCYNNTHDSEIGTLPSF